MRGEENVNRELERGNGQTRILQSQRCANIVAGAFGTLGDGELDRGSKPCV